LENYGSSKDSKEDFREKKIIEGLQQLGFTINDAKVYITLLKLGVSNPATIADESGIDRARVYDSLKRLSKKNIVEMEKIKRSPSYKARSPAIVLQRIQNDLENKLQLSKDLVYLVESIATKKEELGLWALPKKSHIMKSINELIDKADSVIYMIITPDISLSLHTLGKIFDKIIKKMDKNKNMDCKISFNYSNDHKALVTEYLKHGGIFRKWKAGTIMPFGLYLSEKDFIFTILNSVADYPKYEFGIIIENLTEDIKNGYFHFAEWFLNHFCEKEARLIQKKKK